MLTVNEAHDLSNLLQRVMFYTDMAELGEAKQAIRRVNDYVNVHTETPKIEYKECKGETNVSTTESPTVLG